MKKRRLLILSALILPMMAGTLGTTSCGGETDNPNPPIEEPTYENDGNYLEIAEKPSKTEYFVGERLSFEGLRIVKYTIYHDIKSDPITVSNVDYVTSIEEGSVLNEVSAKVTVTIGLADTSYEPVSFDVVVKDKEQHTVTFENYDGTVLSTQLVKDGEGFVYEGTTPLKPDEGEVAYRFDGWFVKGDDSQTLVDLSTFKVTGPLTFVAHFKEGSVTTDGVFNYNLSADVSHYEVMGLNEDYDYASTDITIPAQYNGKPVRKILAKAFRYDEKITSVVIGKNVEEIGDDAFSNCTACESFKFETGSVLNKLGTGVFTSTKACKSIEGIPDTLKSIPKQTFKNCAISTIDLGHGVEVIETGAFESAKNLMRLEFPDSVTTIEEEAFSSNDMLETVKFGKGLKNLDPHSKLFEQENVYKYEVSEENPYFKAVDGILYSKDGKTLVNVPRGFVEPGEDGKVTPVTFKINDEVEVLGEYSLTYHQKDFSEVVLGKNVREIKDNAFRYANGCNITWNDKLEVIGAYAFQGVTGLVGDVVMPDSVTTIKDYAFKGCSKITSFTFGANMENFGQQIFDGNSKVVLKFSETNTKLSIEGNVVYDAAKTKCLYWTNVDNKVTEYVMPDTVKEVANGFLYKSNLTNLTLSANLEKIGDQAFYYMNKLKCDLVLPESLTYIGESAFDRSFNGSTSTSGGSINFPSKIKHLGTRAFASTKNLTFTNKVVLNSDLEFLGDSVFSGAASLTDVEVKCDRVTEGMFTGCSNLKTVKLNDAITTIPKEAFENCKALDTINVPTSLEKISDSAFEGCAALATFDLSNIKVLEKEAFKKSGLVEVKLTEKLESLGESVFYGTSNLGKATFDLELATLPANLFYDSGLKEIVYPRNLATIEDAVFQNCTRLAEVSLPSTVKVLGEKTFSGCSSLVKATLPDSITTIGNFTFEKCLELVEVKLPANLTALPNSMFYGCSKLSSVELPKGITSLGYSCFQDTAFTSFVLPENVDITKASYLFSGSKLTTFTFNSTVDTIPMNMFSNCSSLTEVKGLKEGQLKVISASAFNNCTALESLTIDMSGVTTIGAMAFAGCAKLKSFTLPTNAEYQVVESSLFKGCSALTELTIPANVTQIKGSAFASTSSLTTLNIDNPEITLGTYLCDYKSVLTTVNFKGTVAQAEKKFSSKTFNKKNITVHCTDGDYIIK